MGPNDAKHVVSARTQKREVDSTHCLSWMVALLEDQKVHFLQCEIPSDTRTSISTISIVAELCYSHEIP